jgi:hypothetical protein
MLDHCSIDLLLRFRINNLEFLILLNLNWRNLTLSKGLSPYLMWGYLRLIFSLEVFLIPLLLFLGLFLLHLEVLFTLSLPRGVLY